MNDAPRYLIERWRAEVYALFDDSEREDVLDWLVANHDRKRVILVGSGFSKNANNPHATPIPLWTDISKALAEDLRVRQDAFDALSLADFHRRNQGDSAFQKRLLSLLNDAAIQPGEAHAALWASNPEAVITTNFLDTLLERNPKALPVIEDPDLALPVGETQAQVIYLHGHRSNFQSWVAGRSDYDDLQEKRPMLFARTRQLFAQYPLLVVGYSLTDPDFHLLYRQMVRAMNRRHPMGLAVVFPRNGVSAEQEERAAKKYWEDLGLRIVRFRSTDELPTHQQFVKFFGLTRRLDSQKDIEESYSRPLTERDIAETFRVNVEVMESAFRDPSLERIWLHAWGARASFWQVAMERALPKPLQDSSARKAQTYNLARFACRSAADGRSGGHQEQSANKSQPEDLDPALWEDLKHSAPDLGNVWQLFNEQRGSPLVWLIDSLLRHNADRAVVARWLRAAIRADMLDASNVEIAVVSCALLIVAGWQAEDAQSLHELASPRDSRLAKLIGSPDGTMKVSDPLIALLKQASSALDAGDEARAREFYAEAARTAPLCSHSERALLVYFAREGHADSLNINDFSDKALANLEEASNLARQAYEHPEVRQWWDRVENLKASLQKSKIARLERELSRAGHEARSASWSNSASGLTIRLRDAIRLGAPLSVQAELTEPLLGFFSDDYEELTERLRLNLSEPGEWLARRLKNGDIFRSRSKGIFPDDMQAGSTELRVGVKKVSEILFRDPSNDYKSNLTGGFASSSTCSRRRLTATLNILRNAAEVLLDDDVPRALEAIASGRRSQSHAAVEAIVSLAQVCDWRLAGELLMEFAQSDALDELRGSAQSLPWEHWTLCDNFLHEGERGTELLGIVASEVPKRERRSVGWALNSVLACAPVDEEVIRICAQFAQQVMLTENEGASESDREQIAAFAAVSPLFCERFPDTVKWLSDLLQKDDPLVRGILLQSTATTFLQSEAKRSLLRSDESNSSIHERVARATLDEAQRPIDWTWIRTELSKSWRNLPALAPVLHARYWSPEAWQALADILRVGGHRGKSASWRLERVNLVIEALDNNESREAVFDESKDGLGFLRAVIVDGVGSGDGILANSAVYGLTVLARRAAAEVDVAAVAASLRAAADDVRIGVVHGAAFVAHYLIAYGAVCGLSPDLLDCANQIASNLSNDALSIVRRQAAFGSKQGRRHAAGRNAGTSRT